MIVELYAKSDVGRVRRGNEDNFLVLDLSTEQTWTGGADGNPPPENLIRFNLGDKGLVLVVSDGMGGALAGEPKRIAVANLPYVADFSPTALPTAGYLLAYITPASELRAVFLDGTGDTLVEKGVSAVWALGGRTDLGWWR